MGLIAWFVIVPACLGALLSGVVQSLGSQWGLFKHYWVLVKFAITILATIVLFLHMQPIGYLADIASERALSYSELRGLRIRLIADAGAAFLVLLIATVLSVYKPWGQIQISLSTRNAQEPTTFPAKKSPWGLYVLF